MTINSETRVAGPFEGNDSTVAFPFAFKVFDSDEVLVVLATSALETVLTLGTDYAVLLNPDQNAAPGGTVTLVAPLAVGSRLTLTSALEYLQPLDLTNQGGFYPRVINNAFDRLTILLQQLFERLSRALVFPISDGPVGEIPGAGVRAGTVLAFDDATGDPVVGPRIADVNTVAGANAAIATVAGNIADVNTVAGSIADVNTVAGSIADVNTVAGSIADVSAVAGGIGDVGTVADNLGSVSNFAGVYYGANATDPATRRDGTPLQAGDLYLNTGTGSLRAYTGAAWRESVSGAVTVQNLSGNGVQTEFQLNYAPESEIVTQVFIFGIYQQKNTYELGGVGGGVLVFDVAPPAGTNNIEVVVSSITPSDDKLRQDLANSIEPSLGAALVGYKGRSVADRLKTRVHIKDFGAKGDNITDDIAAFDAAIAYLVAAGGGTIDLADASGNIANYRISRPWKLNNELEIVGKSRIMPTADFSSASVVFPTYNTGVPQTYSCMAYFNNGTHADDPFNFGYSNLRIAPEVVFDCQYNTQADNGIILEGITNYAIDCQITQCPSIGLWVKYYCWGGSVGAYISNCRYSLLQLGPASNGVDLSGLRAYGQNDRPTYGIIITGDNNGIDLSGAFIEKTQNQILWLGGSGPATVSGVDFEDCTGVSIHVDGTGLSTRPAGPVTITGSYLAGGTCAVKATNAIVVVQGCRIQQTSLAFQAAGTESRIFDIANVIEDSVTKRAEGNVSSDKVGVSSRAIENATPNYSSSQVKTFSLSNFTYAFNESIPCSYLDFTSALTDGSLQRQLTSSTWATREMRNGSVFGELGLKLDYSTGFKNIVPVTGGDHSLGTADKPFERVYSKIISQLPGVGASIVPAVNGEIVMQLTSNTTVTVKAKGSDGVIRQVNLTLT